MARSNRRSKTSRELITELLLWLMITLFTSVIVMFIWGTSVENNSVNYLMYSLGGIGLLFSVIGLMFNSTMYLPREKSLNLFFKLSSLMTLIALVSITVLMNYMHFFDKSVEFTINSWALCNSLASISLIPLYIMYITRINPSSANSMPKTVKKPKIDNENNDNDNFSREIN